MGYGAGVLLVRRSGRGTWSEASPVYAANDHHERQNDGDEREMARRGTVPGSDASALDPHLRGYLAPAHDPRSDISAPSTIRDPFPDRSRHSAIRCPGDAASADVDSIPSPIPRARGNHVL
jgi:hypothetical protein